LREKREEPRSSAIKVKFHRWERGRGGKTTNGEDSDLVRISETFLE